MIKRRHWKYLIYLVMTMFVLYVSMSMFYINGLIEQSQTYAIATSREIREMRTRANEVATTLPVLLASPEMSVKEIESELNRTTKKQTETFNRLKSRFRGNPVIMAHLQACMEKVFKSKHLAPHILDRQITFEAASRYCNETIVPLIDDLVQVLDAAYQSVETTSNESMARMHQRFNQIILSTVIAGFIIVIMTMLYDRRMAISSKELAYRDELFKLLASDIDEVFVIAADSSRFDYISPNSERIIGISAGSLYINTAKFFDGLSQQCADALRQILDSRPLESGHEELDLTDRQGQRFFKAFVYSIKVPSIKQMRFIIVISDQTKAHKHQLDLNETLAKANAASAAKSDFLSHMSHEIRTPMNAIIGMTAIAMSRLQDINRVEDCLKKISNSSRHLLGLINDVLDMSKIESGKIAIYNAPFNLHAMVDNLQNIAGPQTKAKHQNFEIYLQNVDEENLIGDAMRINQVLLNILSNAIKFTPEGGQIIFTISQTKKQKDIVNLGLTISDSGIGMSQEFLKRIYMPFEQAHASTASKYGGTGLGMPITANLVRMMGGEINVQSKENEGTTFNIELPLQIAENMPPVWQSLPPLNVLMVDDDKYACEHACMLMSKMGLTPQFALSGKIALDKIQEAQEAGQAFQICLIDWRMPEMDGFETARKISEKVGNDAVIIFVSAYDWDSAHEEAANAGINHFIAKPFFASTLFDGLMAAARELRHEPDKKNEPAARQPGYDFSGKRVLLVEDNEFNREIGQEFLEMVNIQVEHAENGEEAVNKFLAAPPGYYHLILMDVQMPVMDGYAATTAIRAANHQEASSIPIIAMTANAFSEDVARAMSCGMNAHIAKPIEITNLYAVLAKFLA